MPTFYSMPVTDFGGAGSPHDQQAGGSSPAGQQDLKGRRRGQLRAQLLSWKCGRRDTRPAPPQPTGWSWAEKQNYFNPGKCVRGKKIPGVFNYPAKVPNNVTTSPLFHSFS
ncbi:unnamed protein product [Eretmochelys imbricata]